MKPDSLFNQTARPTIGIRMLVDDRCAARTAQEGALQSLALQIKALLEQTVFYGDGVPVQCVIGHMAVGCARDAAFVAQQFKEQRVGAIIHVARAWAYASEIMEYDATLPQAIWGFAGSNSPGTVFMAAATATAEQQGYPFFKIYGQNVQDASDITIPPDVADKLVLFAQCALAVATLRSKTYLCMGTVCMGIGASAVDHSFFRAYLGMRTQMVDTAEVLRRISNGIYDAEEYQTARAWIARSCTEMADPNPEAQQQSRAEKEAVWNTSAKMALVFRDLMVGNPKLEALGFADDAKGCNALAASFQGQRHWTDWMPSSDFAEAILNSSFDWNGARHPLSIATENDALQAVTMAMGTLLTGTAQIFCDVRTYWSAEALTERFGSEAQAAPDGFFYLTNSGPAALDGTMAADVDGKCGIKPYWQMTQQDIDGCMRETHWGANKLSTFSGGGFSTSYRAPGEVPLTMVRLCLVKGLGPVLQLVEGTTLALPPAMAQSIADCTDPTWAQIFFVPRTVQGAAACSLYDIISRWGSNHCTLCYGHIGRSLITLASMLRIPVAMHNLPAQALFRPAAWNMFGTDDATGADYRACAAYGPLYGAY